METLEDRLRADTRVDEWIVALDGAWIEPSDELVVTGRRRAVRRERAYDGVGRRYGLIGKTFNFFSKLRGGERRNVALLIQPA